MSGEQFTLRWIGLCALFAALVAASPYLVEMLVRNGSCFSSEHACRDMAEVVARYGRSMILVLVLILLLVAVAARTLNIGLFAWAFPFALLMVAGSLPLLYAVGGPEVSSWQEAIAHPAVIPLFFLLVLFLSLSVGSEEGVGKVWRVLMPLVALVTLFLTANAWLPGFALMPYAGAAAEPVGHYVGEAQAALGITARVAQLVNTCLIVFVLAAAGMVMSARARNRYA